MWDVEEEGLSRNYNPLLLVGKAWEWENPEILLDRKNRKKHFGKVPKPSQVIL